MHGDGVPCVGIAKSWGKSMDLLSWASCLAAGSTMNTFFDIYGIFTVCLSERFGANTMWKVWKILKWSFECLWEGEWYLDML